MSLTIHQSVHLLQGKTQQRQLRFFFLSHKSNNTGLTVQIRIIMVGMPHLFCVEGWSGHATLIDCVLHPTNAEGWCHGEKLRGEKPGGEIGQRSSF